MEILKILTIVMASLGELISLYFTLATYHVVPEDFIESMPICDIRGQQKRIVDTRFGRVFYLPNSVYGIVYYAGVLVVSTMWWNVWPVWFELALVIMSVSVVIFSAYLFWSLIVKLQTPCFLCITSHLINLIITVIFAFRTIF